ncbi:MAG: tetratricopeptide repeat protein [Gemmatimonadaceae bacterium]
MPTRHTARHAAPTVLAAAALIALCSPSARAQSTRTVAELIAAGDAAWTARRHDAARQAYAEVVRRDSSYSRAVYRLGTLLAWKHSLDDALALYRLYSRLEPRDADGPLAVARTLGWASRYGEALATYDSLLARDRRMRGAALGRAQTLAWSGKLRESRRAYEEWLRDHASDADAWCGLAAALHWGGHTRAAREALRRALEVEPAHAEARAQLRWVEATLSASLEPSVVTTNDTDDNRSTLYSVSAGLPLFAGARGTFAGSHRLADLATLHGTATTGRAAVRWSPGAGRVTLRGELGATALRGGARGGVDSSSTELLAGARVSGRLGRGVSAGVGVARAAFDETAALIVGGLSTTSVDGDFDWALPARLSLGAGVSRAAIAGGTVANTRLAASGALRWTPRRGTSFAVGGRTFGYAREVYDGYFAPKRYRLIEGSVRMSLGREFGWAVEGEAGAGQQSITFFGGGTNAQLASRGTVALIYRWAPGVEWKLSGGLANAASPTTISSAEYRTWNVGVGGGVVIPRF